MCGDQMEDKNKTKKQLVEELRKSDQQNKNWQETFDAIIDIVALLSSDHKFIKVNKACCESLGMREEKLFGKKCYEIVHDLDAPIEDCPIVKTKKSGKVEVGEFSEKGRHFIATASPIFDKNNELISFIHTIKDISERKKVEKALKASLKTASAGCPNTF